MSAAKKNWTARFDDANAWAPLWLAFSIVIGYLLIRCAFDWFFLVTRGFPQGLKPLWQDPDWWIEIVNATLLGYIPAVLVIAFHQRRQQPRAPLSPFRYSNAGDYEYDRERQT